MSERDDAPNTSGGGRIAAVASLPLQPGGGRVL